MTSVTYCAEIGSNHCGSLNLALAHIRAAKRAGATAVKFQLFRAESLDSRPEVREKLTPYEIPISWIPLLHENCHRLKMQFGITPFAVNLIEPLRRLVDFVKISAYDLTYDDLVSAAAGLGVPVVLSTGMATWLEISNAYVAIGKDFPKSIILQGVAQYPARLEDQNLSALIESDLRWGLSDHTLGHEAAMLAIALGATWIEKHFKMSSIEAWEIVGDDRLKESPDYEVSADPWQFAQMVAACERAKAALGTGEKNGPLECEMELYQTCRRTNEKRLRGA